MMPMHFKTLCLLRMTMKEDLKRKLAELQNLNDSEIVTATEKELYDTEEDIALICSERNKLMVEECLRPFEDTSEGFTSGHTWSLKKRLAPKNTLEPPTAKNDPNGTLVTDKDTLEQLYNETYKSRLTPNTFNSDLNDLMSLKSYMFDMNFELAKKERSSDWTLKDLETALKSLKSHKARDIHGHTYELFKFGGKALKESLLNLFNRTKNMETYPSIFRFSTITSIWKKKGSQRDLENDRGIFNVPKIRSILDKLIYNDIYDTVDNYMSCSNIGARKNRNILDHLFVVNAILNKAFNSSVKTPLDIQIFDVSKCFDKLEFFNTANDLYRSGIQNDKFALIAKSNKICNVSVKLPWGKLSESITLKDIEMQGTVLAPLKCSLSIDRIGKEALENHHKHLYKYRNCVSIPPLGMVDDIIAITECSAQSVIINSFIGSKISCMQLELSEKKCTHMHIGNNSNNCHGLIINNSKMKKAKTEKYLGEMLSADGKISENIDARYSKGIGSANTILSLMREVYFGKYFYEMALLFRNSMLINSILCSIEAVYGLKAVHIEKLENVDKYLLRKLLGASSSTAIEALYLETGAMPLRFCIKSRRLMFYWTILSKSETELIRKVYNVQKLAPIKNDWYMQIKDDLESCKIEFSEAEVSSMKKEKFKNIVKERVRNEAREYLLTLKQNHTKSSQLDETFQLQPYLQSDTLSIQEKQLLFKFRTYTYNCKANFKGSYNTTQCNFCNSEDTQEHLFHCQLFKDLNLNPYKHQHIFGSLKEQTEIVKILTLIDQRRTTENYNPSYGSQAHQHGASCT